MEKLIKIGLIGVGSMGKNHLRVIKELSNVYELAGIYDSNKQCLEQYENECHIFESLEDMFSNVDAAVIAVPSFLHKDIALKAAQYNINLFIEKPLALSYEDASEVVEAYKNLDKVLTVGHIERYNPVIIELSKILEKEEIIAVNLQRCSPMNLRIADTDVVYDLMIHDVDILINAIMPGKKIKSVQSCGCTSFSSKFCDYVQSLIQFENNAIASITASRTTEEKIRKIEVHCKDCFVEADLLNKVVSISRKTSYKLDIGHMTNYRQENIVEKVYVPIMESLKNELMAFANCINNKEPSATSGESALESLLVLDKIKSEIYGE